MRAEKQEFQPGGRNQIRHYGRNPEGFDLKRLVEVSTGPGAKSSRPSWRPPYVEFADGRELTVTTIEQVVARSVPLSKTMAEQIETPDMGQNPGPVSHRTAEDGESQTAYNRGRNREELTVPPGLRTQKRPSIPGWSFF